MGITYAESLALQLPGMMEQERTALLWRLQWGELHGLARKLGIEQQRSKPQLIRLISQAAEERATVGTQAQLL